MSYHTILAVINEHTGSTVAARYAMALAASEECKLVLYSAHSEVGDTAPVRLTEKHLGHLFSEAIVLGLDVTQVAEIGRITRILPHRALAEAVDLVLYPLTPGERYGSTLQQQTAYHLLRTIRADLAVMRIMHMGKPHPHRILVPVGGMVSDREQRVRFVASLAKCFHSQVTLFHRPDIGKQDLPDDLVTMQNDLRLRHLPVLERSAPGNIARAIALEAVSHHNDLIVLGASERGTLRHIFFGNPAGEVMRQPPCNAILFRPARLLA
ncbi:MAG: universal stress protein [Desulfuromonadaceae bacterium]|nr:universal stress protein [Desulfuromonadaceae bacterium]